MNLVLSCFRAILFLWLIIPICVLADDSLLQDQNGDGEFSILAFGDSITYGVGDGIAPGVNVPLSVPDVPGGYPARISALAKVAISNRGLPGEQLVPGGSERLLAITASNNNDLFLVLEGANDAFNQVEPSVYEGILQRNINVARVLGKKLVLMTIPAPCCNHAAELPYTRSYSTSIRTASLANNLKVIDLEHAWTTTCENRNECELFNLPEGLHPNTKGYDVIAQTILATLYGIDIFSKDGAKDLESALGLSEGSVIVKPDPEQK